MEERTLYPYVYFGTALWYLQAVPAGVPITIEGGVRDNLESFLGHLDDLGLGVTESIARRRGLDILLDELEDADPEDELTDAQADRINSAVRDLRLALDAELDTKMAFIASPKRWPVEKLLHEPSSLFDPRTFPALEELSRYDFEEACRCMAFERPTAAAFHLMRGTEAVLRGFYCYTVRRERLPDGQRMWGPMVNQMRTRSKPPPSALLDELDNIRTNYRNPTQHPDAIYDIHRAQDLLGVSIAVVNQMVQEMLS
jgi:hypothetical protein